MFSVGWYCGWELTEALPTVGHWATANEDLSQGRLDRRIMPLWCLVGLGEGKELKMTLPKCYHVRLEMHEAECG